MVKTFPYTFHLVTIQTRLGYKPNVIEILNNNQKVITMEGSCWGRIQEELEGGNGGKYD